MTTKPTFSPQDRVIYAGKYAAVIVEVLIDRAGGTGKTHYTIETEGGHIVRRVDESSLTAIQTRIF